MARADVQTVMAVVEHDFENGLTVKNSTLYANYQKFYRNVYPGNGRCRRGNPADTAFNLAAYKHTTNRDNVINQTDFVYKTSTGPVFHTVGIRHRVRPAVRRRYPQHRHLPNGTNTIVANPFDPTYFGPINFVHHFTGANRRRVTTADSNSKYRLNIAVGLCPRYHRSHALAPSDRRGSLSSASICRHST